MVDVSGLAVAPASSTSTPHSDARPWVDYEPESSCTRASPMRSLATAAFHPAQHAGEPDEIGRYSFSQLEPPAGSPPQLGVSGLEEYARMVADHWLRRQLRPAGGHRHSAGAVMGFVDRDPEPEEMEQLKDLQLERS